MSQDPAHGPDHALGDGGTLPDELGHAGAITDKAIEHMLGRDLPPLAIASALLGGALGLLARTMDQRAMERLLENALAGVRSGALHPDRDREAGRAMGAAARPPGPDSASGA